MRSVKIEVSKFHRQDLSVSVDSSKTGMGISIICPMARSYAFLMIQKKLKDIGAQICMYLRPYFIQLNDTKLL